MLYYEILERVEGDSNVAKSTGTSACIVSRPPSIWSATASSQAAFFKPRSTRRMSKRLRRGPESDVLVERLSRGSYVPYQN